MELTEAVLKVPFCKPTASLYIAHSRVLEKYDAVYNYNSSVVKIMALTPGIRSAHLHNIFSGDIPHTLLVGFVPSDAFVGNYAKNPYKFHCYDISHVQLELDGSSIPFPQESVKFDSESYDTSNVSALYSYLVGDGKSPDISKKSFVEGNSILRFDISKKRRGTSIPQKRGFLDLKLQFASDLPESVNVVFYGVFSSKFFVDNARNVKFNTMNV